MNKAQLAYAATILGIEDFAVGDTVSKRTWSLDTPQQPQVERRIRTVTEVRGDEIRCGRFCYDAFELIKR